MSIVDTSSPFPYGTGGTAPSGRINVPYTPYSNPPQPTTTFSYTNPYRLTEEDVNRIADRVVKLLTERFDVKPMRAEEV